MSHGREVAKVSIAPNAMGMVSALEFALEFHKWAGARSHVDAESIRKHWGVSRATAYRYAAAWRAVQERSAAA